MQGFVRFPSPEPIKEPEEKEVATFFFLSRPTIIEIFGHFSMRRIGKYSTTCQATVIE